MFQPSFSTAKTILCFGAHSDDIEIGCGGTLLEILQHNPDVSVHWIVLSGEGPRADEARCSAQHFLSRGRERHEVQIRNFRDTCFPTQWEDIRNCFREIAQNVQPDIIFTHRRDDAHQDHRVAAELTWCTFRSHLVLEYEIAKYEGDLGQPNVFVPISRQNAWLKTDLLTECFPSQSEKPWFDADTFNAMLRLRGLEANSASRFAEGFYCRKMSVSAAPLISDSTSDSSVQTGVDRVCYD